MSVLYIKKNPLGGSNFFFILAAVEINLVILLKKVVSPKVHFEPSQSRDPLFLSLPFFGRAQGSTCRWVNKVDSIWFVPFPVAACYGTDRLQFLGKFDNWLSQILFKMKRETNPAAMTHLVPTGSCCHLISESHLFEILS